MLAILIAPVYFLINFYMVKRCMQWIDTVISHKSVKAVKIVFAVVYIFTILTPLTSFLIPGSPLKSFLKRMNNFWLGFMLYTLALIAAADVIRIILEKTHYLTKNKAKRRVLHILTGVSILTACLSVTIYGTYHAYDLKTAQYQIEVPKSVESMESLKIVMLADLHLGYNTNMEYLETLVGTINRQQADLVCISGDIFDNEYEALSDPEAVCSLLAGIKSKYGVYGCYGNHDIDEKLLAGFTFGSEKIKTSSENMRAFLKKAGMKILTDETVLIDGKFYLTGRRDASRTQSQANSRVSPKTLLEKLDHSKPIIVMDHQPRELQELAEAGADLDLCGHTHNGQMFPANLLMNMIWEKPYGYLQKDGMHLVVTSGCGVWGPNMRIGTDSEITVIHASFLKTVQSTAGSFKRSRFFNGDQTAMKL